MIRHLIIPGIAAGAAHAVLLITLPDATLPPAENAIIADTLCLDDLQPPPPIPPIIEKRDDDTLETPNFKPALPFLIDTVVVSIDNPFKTTLNRVLPPIGGKDNIRVIPAGHNPYEGGGGLGDGLKPFSLADIENKPRRSILTRKTPRGIPAR